MLGALAKAAANNAARQCASQPASSVPGARRHRCTETGLSSRRSARPSGGGTQSTISDFASTTEPNANRNVRPGRATGVRPNHPASTDPTSHRKGLRLMTPRRPKAKSFESPPLKTDDEDEPDEEQEIRSHCIIMPDSNFRARCGPSSHHVTLTHHAAARLTTRCLHLYNRVRVGSQHADTDPVQRLLRARFHLLRCALRSP